MIAGAFLAMLSVIMGAFAAHGLQQILPAEKIEIFQKGVTYQFYHSFALLIAGIAYSSFQSSSPAEIPLILKIPEHAV